MSCDPKPIVDPDFILEGVSVWSTPVGDSAADLSSPRQVHYRFQGRSVHADELRAVRDAITAALAAAQARAEEHTSR